jgi:twitching motility protein PilI
MTASTDLRELKDAPFDLLRAMENRGIKAASESVGQQQNEWNGLAYRLGDETFVCAREDVKELLVYPDAITRIPGAKGWLTGLANIRGQLLPVVDLKAFLGGATTRPGRDTRVIVVNHRDLPAGMVVDEVIGFRRFRSDQRLDQAPETAVRCERYLQGAFSQETEMWPVFSLLRLVESQQFLQAGKAPDDAAPREQKVG